MSSTKGSGSESDTPGADYSAKARILLNPAPNGGITGGKNLQPIKLANPPILLTSEGFHQLLTSINNVAQGITYVSQKMTETAEVCNRVLDKLSNLTQPSRDMKRDCIHDKPEFLPFASYDEVDAYATFSDELRDQLKNWLSNFRGGSSANEKVRFILKENRLLTEDLLTRFVYKKQQKGENSKRAWCGSRLDYDLYHVLKSMYPDFTQQLYITAIQAAFKAADARVGYKRPKLDKTAPEPSKRIKIDYSEEWENY